MKKLSKYTQILVNEENSFLFHLATENVLTLTQELAHIVLEHKENIEELENIHPELYACMLQSEMIVPEELDEAQALFDLWKAQNEDPSFFGMIINPTLDCNLRCWYCYEKHDVHAGMSPETIESVCRLIDHKVADERLQRLSVSFFGGEPLMYYKKVVAPILHYAVKVCKKKSVALFAHFTTNAVLLTNNILNELNDIGLSQLPTFQITLDGNRDLHNQTRYAAKKKPTYDTIVNNIKTALKAGNQVAVRFNYTDSNIESFVDVMGDFIDLPDSQRKLLNFTFEQVWQCGNKDTKRRAIEVANLFIENGLFASYDTLYTRHNCYADMVNNIVINYNGDVFKCTARDFLPERREGSLEQNGQVCWNKLYEKRMNIRFCNKACKACKILPLCNGRCSQSKLETSVIDSCYLNMSEDDKKLIVLGRLKQVLTRR